MGPIKTDFDETSGINIFVATPRIQRINISSFEPVANTIQAYLNCHNLPHDDVGQHEANR